MLRPAWLLTLLDRSDLEITSQVDCPTSIPLAELQYGAAKSEFPKRNFRALAKFVALLEVPAFDSQAAAAYGPLHRAINKRRGHHFLLKLFDNVLGREVRRGTRRRPLPEAIPSRNWSSGTLWFNSSALHASRLTPTVLPSKRSGLRFTQVTTAISEPSPSKPVRHTLSPLTTTSHHIP